MAEPYLQQQLRFDRVLLLPDDHRAGVTLGWQGLAQTKLVNGAEYENAVRHRVSLWHHLPESPVMICIVECRERLNPDKPFYAIGNTLELGDWSYWGLYSEIQHYLRTNFGINTQPENEL